MSTAAPQDIFEHLRACVERGPCEADAADHSIDVDRYVSEQRLTEERRYVFERFPLILAHEGMLPAANSCMRHDELGVPLLLCRDAEGRLRAFYNVCRHRMARLVGDEGPCHRSRLSCPYHGWTYALDGRLIGVPRADGFPELDMARSALVEVPTASAYGFVFAVRGGEAGAEAGEHLAPLARHFDAFGVGEHVYFAHAYADVASNWKVIYDAFSEAYHIQRLHRNSLAEFFLDNMVVLEPMGLHVCSAVGRAEMIEGTQPPGSVSELRALATFNYHVFPNAILIVSPDYMNMLVLYPQTPHRTRVLNVMLTSHAPDTDKARDHWQRSFDLLHERVFCAEDFWISEQVQIGLRSGCAKSFRIGRYEQGLRLVQGIFDAEMQRQKRQSAAAGCGSRA